MITRSYTERHGFFMKKTRDFFSVALRASYMVALCDMSCVNRYLERVLLPEQGHFRLCLEND